MTMRCFLSAIFAKPLCVIQIYKDAYFHSTEEITELLNRSGFRKFEYLQTLTKLNENEIEKSLKGYGQGTL